MPTEIEVKKEERDIKAKALADILEEAKTDNPKVLDLSKVKALTGTNEEKRLEVKRLNDELSGLGMQIDLMQVKADLDKIKKTPADGSVPLPSSRSEFKSLGAYFAQSQELKDFGTDPTNWRKPLSIKDVELKDLLSGVEAKTVMTTAAGWAPQAIRSGRVVEIATRPIQVLDTIPQGTTNQSAVVYMEETTFTNNAAEKAEGVAYPEQAFALTERTQTVRKVAAFVPVTDEQLEDVDQVESYINNRLTFSLRQRIDSQVLMGDGTAPNLQGITDLSIQTQAKGADSTPAAIYKALVKIRVTGRASPSAVMIHPNDWQDVRLLTTADGIFLWGSPSEAGPERIWGLPVVQTDVLTEGTGLAGDFTTFCQLVYKRGIELSVGYINDDFKLGQKSIRADVRCAMVTYRVNAFCSITGI